MSFVLAAPAALAAAASDIAGIGSTISAANAAAAVPTTGVLAAAADEVSAQVAALFSTHGQGYQKLSAQLAAFHDQFVGALNSSAGQYAAAEAGAAQNLLSAINAPAEKLLGQPVSGLGGIVSDAVSRIQSAVTGGPSALGLRPTGGANGVAAAATALLRPAASVAAAPAGSIGAAIENAYLVIEPYVEYGFEVAAYAAGWIPYVGWIVGAQIYFFYDLIEPMVQAGLFNTIDWLSGSISFAQGWSNFWDVTTASINQFINSEFNWIFGTLLPPLPPLPPLFP